MQHMANQYPGRPAEVSGDAGRSKAQLIVGIDFVRMEESVGRYTT
jgi:hypothetical protein